MLTTTEVGFVGLVLAVAVCRVAELRVSHRHQRVLAGQGARPVAEPVFRAMVALHTGVLIAAVVEVVALHRPFLPGLGVPALIVFALANALRFWVIATLGVHWNVRVVPSEAMGVVTGGPYRFVRHPNYVAVFAELLALPLVHGAYVTAGVGAVLHIVILRRRIALEESVLLNSDAYRRAFANKPRFLPWLA